ncbi:lactonase family protein [Aquirufa sp.]|jgi:6-phosphogluconolactonase (cycloisomerase 2 family)|uniref:lactonase family protein n=1 Tax=Aquirufa sp. TaxID=2676249 RepID=UPI0037BF8E27
MLMLFHSLMSLLVTPADTLIVGSYTQQGNPGIEIINTQTKQVLAGLAVPQASYQYVTSDGQYLFSVSEQVSNAGAVYSFKKNDIGQWDKLSQQLTEGDAPCHINFRKKSQTLYTANYMGGSVSVFQTKKGVIEPLSQKLEYFGKGLYPKQQATSHGHMVVLSKDETKLHVSDLGADKIYHYDVRPDGLLEDKYSLTQFPAGTGPRHFVFSEDEKFVYVLGELSGTVDVYEVSNGKWNQIQRETIDFSKVDRPKASADIHLTPDGKWLLASNRITQNSITVFRIQSNGRLVFKRDVPVGKVPRNFQIDKTSTRVYVACKEENRIQQFSFNADTGDMIDLNDDILVKSPVALLVR